MTLYLFCHKFHRFSVLWIHLCNSEEKMVYQLDLFGLCRLCKAKYEAELCDITKRKLK
jgi:hypothetical protein